MILLVKNCPRVWEEHSACQGQLLAIAKTRDTNALPFAHTISIWLLSLLVIECILVHMHTHIYTQRDLGIKLKKIHVQNISSLLGHWDALSSLTFQELLGVPGSSPILYPPTKAHLSNHSTGPKILVTIWVKKKNNPEGEIKKKNNSKETSISNDTSGIVFISNRDKHCGDKQSQKPSPGNANLHFNDHFEPVKDSFLVYSILLLIWHQRANWQIGSD